MAITWIGRRPIQVWLIIGPTGPDGTWADRTGRPIDGVERYGKHPSMDGVIMDDQLYLCCRKWPIENHVMGRVDMAWEVFPATPGLIYDVSSGGVVPEEWLQLTIAEYRSRDGVTVIGAIPPDLD